jgi:hypothetical protein
MKTHGRETNAACKVAEWLGLVTPDSKSEIGWKPTTLFVDQVLQRKQYHDRTQYRSAKFWEKEAFTEIWEASIKKGDETCVDCEDYARWFLWAIGLMTESKDGDLIPTSRFLNLAAASKMRTRKKVKK